MRKVLFWVLLMGWGGALRAADLSLQIVDLQGAAIGGATVEVRDLSVSRAGETVTTDAEGRARISAVLPLEIRVSATGFDPLVERIETGKAGNFTLRLRPATLHTSVDVVVRDVPGTGPSVSSAVEIDKSGARTVYDAVDKLVPAAYVTRRGVMGLGLGIGNGVLLRGIGGSPTTGLLVVVDGRPDFMGLMGHPIPDFYTLSDVEMVSVTEGPASVLYGNGAMGGVIEIKPVRPREGVHTELTTSLGSYYTGQHRLNHGARMGRGFYNLTAGVEHTNGERENASFRNQYGTLAFGYDFSEVWKASVQSRYGHFNVEDPGTVWAPAAGQWSRVGRGGISVSLNNSTGRTWGDWQFFSSHGHHMIYDGFRSVDSATGFRLHQNFVVASRLTVDGGAEAARYGGRANNIKTAYDYGEFHLNEGAGFARANYSATRNLLLNAGVRYDYNSLAGGITVPEFGATYRLGRIYSFSASAARGFRNPTIRELYLFPVSTPTLKPERLWNYQGTFQVRPVRTLTASVTGYYADLTNMIVSNGHYPNPKYDNIGHALNRGLEANARWQPVRRVSFNSGYAYLRSTNLAPYAPRHKANYSLDVDAGRLFFSLGGVTVGRTWGNTAHTQTISGYTVMTLKCTAPLGKHTSAFVTLDNLLDRRYQVLYGYTMPGTNAAGGLTLRF
jgi:iron complex outermembrane receptor protein